MEVGEMQISLALQTYSAPIKNKSITGELLSVAGERFQKGIGVHSASKIKIKINDGQRFTAKVGVNDSKIDYSSEQITSIPLTDGKRMFYEISDTKKQFVGVEGNEGGVSNGSVKFILLHNGKEVYNSGIMRKGQPFKEVDITVKGGMLEMIVDDAGDGESGDHAVWADPKITYFEVPPIMVAYDYQGERPEQSKEISSGLKDLISYLPEIKMPLPEPEYDWLINNEQAKASVYRSGTGKDIVLTNGLVARVFRLLPNLATIDYVNQMTGESLLRSVSNEGTLVLDGKEYTIGGLSGQPEFGYTLMEWLDTMLVAPNSFMIQDFEVKDISDRLEWKRVRWASNTQMPSGKELIFTLAKNDILVKVHYALYDGIPTLSKWIEVINKGDIMVQLNEFKLEQLAMVEGESLVDVPQYFEKPNIHIETDYAFGAMQQKTSDKTTFWETDPRYTSQTNYAMQLPAMLEVKPPLGPNTAIAIGDTLTTFRVWETPFDSYDKERNGLFIRKMYRTISPWATENPIFLHLTSTDTKKIKEAVDQCAEVGYEMIILSFGSGLDMEKESAEYYKKFKKYVDYAKSKGIELGGYSLLSSRWISDEVDVINPETGKRGGMIFGSSPCLSSDWGYNYFRKIKTFFNETGMSVFENDGSYPGNVCASTTHAHHNGLEDSQWKQYAQIQGLYKWMRAKGIYMNVPDFYINSGTNKTGIGYREVNWSLPRARQLVLGRQNLYDGLWKTIPSMSWTFVPLTEYHGGGEEATLEPLKDHLVEYESHMMQNYGAGVQACYRGPRLYDTPETKAVVTKVINWYKKYRDILNSDVVHLKRPSGKDWDGFLHVNPKLKEKGFVMVFNPLDKDVVREIKLPLYYTGISKTAYVREKEGPGKKYNLDREYEINVKVTIPANSYTWLVVE
ncbi:MULTISPECIES: NPCBM/NEW2 domain-containing protein [unclassified Arenibacter]|uniref:NPCBM/NEW2 domain-containing protein n=1 Tax=unclassified Arenibacter TaxID=2615047 RepID=UPI001C6F3918|nr:MULTISPECIES: NPCBM/NEW2 domain-containing protein [unclassified Arenibacter]